MPSFNSTPVKEVGVDQKKEAEKGEEQVTVDQKSSLMNSLSNISKGSDCSFHLNLSMAASNNSQNMTADETTPSKLKAPKETSFPQKSPDENDMNKANSGADKLYSLSFGASINSDISFESKPLKSVWESTKSGATSLCEEEPMEVEEISVQKVTIEVDGGEVSKKLDITNDGNEKGSLATVGEENRSKEEAMAEDLEVSSKSPPLEDESAKRRDEDDVEEDSSLAEKSLSICEEKGENMDKSGLLFEEESDKSVDKVTDKGEVVDAAASEEIIPDSQANNEHSEGTQEITDVNRSGDADKTGEGDEKRSENSQDAGKKADDSDGREGEDDGDGEKLEGGEATAREEEEDGDQTNLGEIAREDEKSPENSSKIKIISNITLSSPGGNEMSRNSTSEKEIEEEERKPSPGRNGSPKKSVGNLKGSFAVSPASDEEPLIDEVSGEEENSDDDSLIPSTLDVIIKKKMDQVNSLADDDSGDDSDGDFFLDMADEGEEDTPSEDSNAIIDEGQSVGSSCEDQESSDSYDEDDSFIDDEEHELLSGFRRIIAPSDSSSDDDGEKEEDQRVALDVSGGKRKSIEAKRKSPKTKETKNELNSGNRKSTESPKISVVEIAASEEEDDEEAEVNGDPLNKSSARKSIEAKRKSPKIKEASNSELNTSNGNFKKIKGKSPNNLVVDIDASEEEENDEEVEANEDFLNKSGARKSIEAKRKSPKIKEISNNQSAELKGKSPKISVVEIAASEEEDDEEEVEMNEDPLDKSGARKSIELKRRSEKLKETNNSELISCNRKSRELEGKSPKISMVEIAASEEDDEGEAEVNEDPLNKSGSRKSIESKRKSAKLKAANNSELITSKRKSAEFKEMKGASPNITAAEIVVSKDGEEELKAGEKSIILQESLQLVDGNDSTLTEQITKLVNKVCSGLKRKSGEISVNVSLEVDEACYEGAAEPRDEEDDVRPSPPKKRKISKGIDAEVVDFGKKVDEKKKKRVTSPSDDVFVETPKTKAAKKGKNRWKRAEESEVEADLGDWDVFKDEVGSEATSHVEYSGVETEKEAATVNSKEQPSANDVVKLKKKRSRRKKKARKPAADTDTDNDLGELKKIEKQEANKPLKQKNKKANREGSAEIISKYKNEITGDGEELTKKRLQKSESSTQSDVTDQKETENEAVKESQATRCSRKRKKRNKSIKEVTSVSLGENLTDVNRAKRMKLANRNDPAEIITLRNKKKVARTDDFLSLSLKPSRQQGQNDSWLIEDLDDVAKPSTSNTYNFHPKDFKNRTLFGGKAARQREDTKTMLMRKKKSRP